MLLCFRNQTDEFDRYCSWCFFPPSHWINTYLVPQINLLQASRDCRYHMLNNEGSQRLQQQLEALKKGTLLYGCHIFPTCNIAKPKPPISVLLGFWKTDMNHSPRWRYMLPFNCVCTRCWLDCTSSTIKIGGNYSLDPEKTWIKVQKQSNMHRTAVQRKTALLLAVKHLTHLHIDHTVHCTQEVMPQWCVVLCGQAQQHRAYPKKDVMFQNNKQGYLNYCLIMKLRELSEVKPFTSPPMKSFTSFFNGEIAILP